MLLAATLLLPAAAVLVTALAGTLPPAGTRRVRRAATILAPLTVLPAVVLALVVSPGEPTREVPWLLMGSHFSVDPTGRSLLMIGALLYGAALMAVSWVTSRDAERGSGALSAFLMVSYLGNAGVYLAADVVSFYLAFTLMSFAATGLVIHHRHAAARRAARIYLVMSVLAETMLLAGVLMVVSELLVPNQGVDAAAGGEIPDGPTDGLLLEYAPEAITDSPRTGLILVLLVAGIGIKVGTMPLHVWLPLAHPAAPPAASAVLSGAMVKAGVVGWLRFLPFDDVDPAVSTAGWTLLVLALGGAFLAVIFGVLQEDPKVVLAYSTISQMGFIAALVGAAMIAPDLAPAATGAAVLYAVHHGLAKGALFLGVQVVRDYVPAGARSVSGGVVLMGMAGAGLAVAGAPLTSGALGKYASKEAVTGISVLGLGLEHILPLVATGSILLLMRFAAALWNSRSEAPAPRRPDGELIGWLLLVVAGITVPWWIGEQWLRGRGIPVQVPSWELGTLWDSTWPILLGAVVGAAAWFAARRGRLPAWDAGRADGSAIQPGDLVVPEEAAVTRLRAGGNRQLDVVHRRASWSGSVLAATGRRGAEAVRRVVQAADARLGAWEVSGTMIVLLTGGAAVLTAISAGWFWF